MDKQNNLHVVFTGPCGTVDGRQFARMIARQIAQCYLREPEKLLTAVQ